MKFHKIKFNDIMDDTSTFILWLVTVILSIIFLYSVTNPLLKYIFLASLVILLLFALYETKERFLERETHKSLKETPMNMIWMKVNVANYFWIIGLILILFSLFMLVFIQEFLINPAIISPIQFISPIIMLIGFFFFLIGRFGRVYENEEIHTLMRILEIAGIMMSISGIYLYGYTLFYESAYLFEILFYGTLLFGLGFIFVEELAQKKKNEYRLVLLLIALIMFIAIVDFTFNPTEFFFYRQYRYIRTDALHNLTVLRFLDILFSLAFVSFLLICIFYLISRNKLKLERNKDEKEIIKALFYWSAVIWITSMVLIVIII